MVKANAYGHGLISIVKYVFEKKHIKNFGVATILEGVILRSELPSLIAEIYIFSDYEFASEQCLDDILNYRLIPVISTLDDLFFVLNSKRLENIPLCLKFNTGMNRLGIGMQELDKVIDLLREKKREIFHLMSHFSSASQRANLKRTQLQLKKFKELKEKFSIEKIAVTHCSIANSGALEQNIGTEYNFIRPGLVIYGVSSLVPTQREKSKLNIELVSRLRAPILKLFQVSKGEPIGYGGNACPFSGWLVIIGLGYGDGLPTTLSGSYIFQKGIKGQVVGRVNMDMLQILFPKEAKGLFNKGDEFIFWDFDQKNFLSFSDQSKKNPYELLCQLTARIPRVYSV